MVDSQDLDLFDQDDDSSIGDLINTVMDGGIITNLQYISGSALAREEVQDNNFDVEGNDKVDNKNVVMLSPDKLIRKATASSGIPLESSQGQQDLVQDMIRELVKKRGSNEMPSNLAVLATRVGIDMGQALDNHTPSHTMW